MADWLIHKGKGTEQTHGQNVSLAFEDALIFSPVKWRSVPVQSFYFAYNFVGHHLGRAWLGSSH